MAKRIDDLADAVERHAKTDDVLHETPIPQLVLFRTTTPGPWAPALYEPAIIAVAQGGKEVEVGGVVHRYDPAHYVLAAIDLPAMCRVSKASARAPYLALKVQLDPVLVGELLAEGVAAAPPGPPERGLVVTPVDAQLQDALARLVALLDTPADLPILAPLVLRELTYRVLTGPQGGRLRQGVAGGPGQRVARAIAWIKSHAAEPLRMDVVARRVGMGLSAFHQHFKAVTGMSPLQFQKRLRLLEARRLLVAEGRTAAEAAYQVGYESPSQFSREYRRAFKVPPRQDAVALRATPAAQGAPT